ncbi:gliding motility-associated C-terminal domain-containing protein [Bernardetia sp. ABR2-2B]|uniref:T9SS type B sorting domain-containing protein n=1 Tax=Bernardetia sp. ABR2-2B TaxID=3127472 RepID=UPI0030CE4CDB
MKALFFTLLFYSLLFPFSDVFSQSFQNTYGLTGNQEGIASVAVGDGYVILGDIQAGSRKDLYLSKIDENGELVWQRTYGDSNTDETSWHLLKTSDNGFLISASTTASFSSVDRVLFIKTDNNGNIQWQKTYTYSNYVAPTHALELSNGEYMITGYFAFDSNRNNRSGMVMRISATGTIIWCRGYHRGGFNDDQISQYFIGIRQIQNGNFIIPTAYGGNGSGTPSGRYDNSITCIDGSGNQVWGKRFGASDNDEFRVILPISSTETIVAGSYRNTASDLEMAFCKVQQNGTITQRKKFGRSGFERVFYATATADRSKLYFVGYTSSVGGGDRDMLVLCTDINGNYLWSKAFGGTGFEEARSVVLTNDGNGIVIIGRTASFGAGQNDIYAVKIEDDTDVQCNQTNFTDPVEDITGTISNITFNTTSITLGNGNALNTGSIALTKNSTCCTGSVIITGTTTISCSAPSTTLSTSTGYTSYLWTFPDGTTSTNRVITTSQVGVHSLRATNTSNCEFFAQTTVTSSIPTSPDLLPTSSSLPCEGTTTLSAPNGYTSYLWTLPNGTTLTTQDITASATGTYSLQVQNASGCTFTDQTDVVIDDTTPTGLDLLPTSSSLPCEGTTTLSAPNGYTSYLWTLPNGTTLTTQDITASATGTYSLQVQNASGCTFTDQTDVVIDDTTPTGLDLLPTSSSLPCEGTTTLSAPNGYTSYLWTLPNGTTLTTQDITASELGTYSLQVQNASGCTFTDQTDVVIDDTTPTGLDLLPTSSSLLCGGTTTLSAPNGYTSYLWTLPNGTTLTTQDITASELGTYSLQVQNASGCTFTDQTDVVIDDTTPTGLDLLPTSSSLLCGGTITLSAPNGYTSYLWTLPNGTTLTTQDITASATGTYSLQVQNASGCTFTDQTDVVIDDTTPTGLDLLPTSSSLLCGGTITLSAPNGYTSYLWTLPNGTTLTTQDITASAAGTYSLQVQNASGCTFTDQTDVVIDDTTPTGLDLLPTSSSLPCGGTTTLSAPNGYTSYLWTLPNGTTLTTQDITASAAGTYSLQVQNASGCTFTDQTDVVIDDTTPTGLDLLPTSSSLPCGGTTTLSAPNGYTSYLWTLPNGTTLTTQDITASATGTYSLQVQNASGCTFTDQTDVVIDDTTPTGLDLLPTSSSLPCGGTTTLSAPNGYTSYLWTLPNGTTLTTQDITASATGTYSLQVQNASGCTFTDQTDVVIDDTTPTGLDLLPTSSSLPCGGTTTLSAPNGYTSYLWTLPNGTTSTNESISTTLEGIYIIEVQNANGCRFMDSLNVQFVEVEKELIQDSFELKCINQSVELSLVENFAEYLWIFPNGETSTEKIIMTNQEGVYKIIVVDEFGCQFEDTTEVKAINPTLTEEDVTNIITPNADGFNDTFVFPTDNAKLSIYSRWEEKVYQSDNYQHNWNADNLPSGMYFVIAYDPCSDSEVRLWIHVIKD